MEEKKNINKNKNTRGYISVKENLDIKKDLDSKEDLKNMKENLNSKKNTLAKKIQYYSKDKMYVLNRFSNRRFNLKNLAYCFLLITAFTLLIGSYLVNISMDKESDIISVGYSENGNADYTVFLKDNTFYDTNYLASGMQYVASLINTINTKFNYEIHSEKNVDLKYKYKVIGTLQIMDPTDSRKILYTKDEILLDEVTKEENSNNLVINEDVIIDYGKYNDYVNSYKREYGLSVNSRLLVYMTVSVDGISDATIGNSNKNSKLQISIPLSEQTVDISIDKETIDDSGYLSTGKEVKINNYFFFILGIIIIMISIPSLGVAIKLFKVYSSSNIYNNTVNRILKNYDRLIVNGKVTLDEAKYNNIVIPETFEEMVDASQNLKSPIIFYEVIKGEKCFFVIIKDDTLYKYRLTKAYLERKKNEADQK